MRTAASWESSWKLASRASEALSFLSREGVPRKLMTVTRSSTGIRGKQGLIESPLVELLLSPSELAQVCEACGEFEDAHANESRRFKVRFFLRERAIHRVP